jgi:hypothetical protein
VLIPLVIGIAVQFARVRPNPPKLTEEKARNLQRIVRLCGLGAIGVAVIYFFLMIAR